MIYHFKTHRARQLLYALENFNEKTMKEVILKKAMGANDVRTNTEECVAYYAFSMYGYDWVVHEEVEETNHGDFPCWEISELSTGGRIPFDVPCMERQDPIRRALHGTAGRHRPRAKVFGDERP
jgi:hypothetical protein